MPRRLEQKESLHSLNQWKSVFRNYYRRCPYYSRFLLPTAKWDNSVRKGFTSAETTGLKRDIDTLAADLDGFLDCLSSFLPFDYVADKLKQESTDIASVWSIIYEVYDAEINTTNFLDYATMSQNPDETYRAYFNRLVGFIRQYLPARTYEAEGVVCPSTGEQLTIALLDAVTIHWLLSIDKRLLPIVKTEFATELKSKRICQMVKIIAQNIDDLLVRYDNRDQVSMVNISRIPAKQNYSSKQDNEIDGIIRRLNKLESASKRRQDNRFRNKSKNNSVCSHCTLLNTQLGSTLPVNHAFSDCGGKSVAISLIESIPAQDSSEAISSTSEGEHKSIIPSLNQHLQNDVSCTGHNSPETVEIQNLCHLPPQLPCEKFISTTPVSDSANNSNDSSSQSTFHVSVARLSSSRYNWENIIKSSSPKLRCCYEGVTFSSLVDSGAEVNVLDADFANELNIQVISSRTTAQAANQLPLKVVGQTQQPITIQCLTESGMKPLYLGILLVVQNLGSPCLLGEPAKSVNNIICLPRHKLILLANGDDVQYAKYDCEDRGYVLARAISNVMLNPGDQIKYDLPPELSSETHVAVSPRSTSIQWLTPQILPVSNCSIYLTNSSDFPVPVQKHDHIADVRETKVMSTCQALPFSTPSNDDQFQFLNLASKKDLHPDYLQKIQVDPDNVLTKSERDKFIQLHKQFYEVFTPQPGKYNGSQGFIDNKLQFSALPPPNSRTRIPNYSPAMNQILAEKWIYWKPGVCWFNLKL